jgi:hypothetical protein
MIQLNEVGFVVIGRNEGVRLNLCLNSLPLKACSIVYVDSDSSDGSQKYAQSLNINMVELSTKNRINASVARNAGFQHLMNSNSSIKLVHFIDADCELDENWIDTVLNKFNSDPSVSIICGRLREKFITQSIYNKLADMSWYIKPGLISGCGGIATVTCSVFLDNNGFDEQLIAGADPEFYKRVVERGGKISCIDSVMGTHDSSMLKFSQWWVRTVKTGFGFANGRTWGGWKNKEKSIILWALIFPLVISSSSFLNPYFIFTILLYPAQILRIAFKLDIPYSFVNKLLYSSFIILGKFPQLLGIIKYHFNSIIGIESTIIEYKAR